MLPENLIINAAKSVISRGNYSDLRFGVSIDPDENLVAIVRIENGYHDFYNDDGDIEYYDMIIPIATEETLQDINYAPLTVQDKLRRIQELTVDTLVNFTVEDGFNDQDQKDFAAAYAETNENVAFEMYKSIVSRTSDLHLIGLRGAYAISHPKASDLDKLDEKMLKLNYLNY